MARNVIEVIARGRDFVSPALGKISTSLGKLQKSVFSLQGAFVALGTGFAGQRIKDLALFTANVDLLRLSMEQLARVNGVNIKFLNATVTVMKSLGVATDDAIRTLNSFIRLNLDLTKATKFVRVAQDLAVISQKTTSKVVEQLTRGITTLNARMLRSAGVFFTSQQASKEWAEANDRTVASMSVAEKQAAVLNKIIEDGAKVAGAYEASLSLAGKKVLQLDRLWKEAKLAIGEFTQEGLRIGVESIQDYLKSIVLLRESGRLDEFGKSMTNALVTIVNTIKGFTKAIISSGKFLFEWRKAILLVVGAFIGLKIISSVIGSINSLNAALLASQGSALVPFITSVQTLTTEIGLLQAASISAATALTIFGTGLAGLGIGAAIGKVIGSSELLRKTFNDFFKDSPKVQKFVDNWVFGWAQIAEAEKIVTEAAITNAELRIKIRLAEAKKTISQLAKVEAARRASANAELQFNKILANASKLKDTIFLTGIQKKIKSLAELEQNLINVTASKAFQDIFKAKEDLAEGFIGPVSQEAIAAQEAHNEAVKAALETLKTLRALRAKAQEEELARLDQLKEQKERLRQEELQKVADHGNLLAEVMAARLELFVANAKSSVAVMGDAILAVSEQIKSSIDNTLTALITQSQTMEQIWTSLWRSMLRTVISAITQIITQQLVMLTAQLLGIKTQAIAETASNAAEIYGNSFASAAAIPKIGFAIAPGEAKKNVAIFLSEVGGIAAAGGVIGSGITALAEGGIVDRPTLALIGEAGPEVIAPLDKIGGSSITIQKMELFPNITDGEFLMDLPRTTLERWAREELIPVFNTLNDRNIRPERGIG